MATVNPVTSDALKAYLGHVMRAVIQCNKSLATQDPVLSVLEAKVENLKSWFQNYQDTFDRFELDQNCTGESYHAALATFMEAEDSYFATLEKTEGKIQNLRWGLTDPSYTSEPLSQDPSLTPQSPAPNPPDLEPAPLTIDSSVTSPPTASSPPTAQPEPNVPATKQDELPVQPSLDSIQTLPVQTLPDFVQPTAHEDTSNAAIMSTLRAVPEANPPETQQLPSSTALPTIFESIRAANQIPPSEVQYSTDQGFQSPSITQVYAIY